jgi:hypothetical protein
MLATRRNEDFFHTTHMMLQKLFLGKIFAFINRSLTMSRNGNSTHSKNWRRWPSKVQNLSFSAPTLKLLAAS